MKSVADLQKNAFSLVEILIVVAILGILAAVTLPSIQGHIIKAKEAAAKDNLRMLRNAIEVYAAQHKDVPPGYPNDNIETLPDALTFIWQLCWASKESGEVAQKGTPGYNLGPYLNEYPRNIFNDAWIINFLNNNEAFPAKATGNFAYVYKPATKAIKLDWPGTDSTGIRYYDY